MKAFNPIQKDKLILTSLIEEDLPHLFKNLSDDFKNNTLYMKGVSQKWGLDYDNTRKYYKNELKDIINENDFKLVSNFFETLSDKLSFSENKELIIYSVSFLYRFLFNLYYLNDLDLKICIETLILSRFPKEENTPLFNKSSISTLKSVTNDFDEQEVQTSLVVMSEMFYYLVKQKALPDEYRESVTHGITGCFLLEEDNLKQIVTLSEEITVFDFFDIILNNE